MASNSAAQVSTVLNTGWMPSRCRSARTPPASPRPIRYAARRSGDPTVHCAWPGAAGPRRGPAPRAVPAAALPTRRSARRTTGRRRRPPRCLPHWRQGAAPARCRRAAPSVGGGAQPVQYISHRAVVVAAGPETGAGGLQRAHHLAERFDEVAAQRHCLADGLHRGGQRGVGAGGTSQTRTAAP